MDSARLKTLVMGLGCVALAALLLGHAAHYFPFVSDDAFISLRYAQRWVTGHGLTWTDGEPVEGYTNFLWVVLNSASGWLGFDYLSSARALGYVGVLLAVLSTGYAPRTGRLSAPRLFVGGALLVGSAPLAIWSIGGLEQGLMAGTLAVAMRALDEARERDDGRLLLAGLAFAALALLRADGGVLLIGAVIAVGCVPRPSRARWRRALWLALPAVVASAAQLCFRGIYYGQWRPNTAVAKVAFTSERLWAGLDYVTRGFVAAAPLVAAAVAACALAYRAGRAPALVAPLAVTATWCAYLTVVGGDIFPGWRQLVVVIVLLCLIVSDELDARWQSSGSRRLLSAGAAIVIALSSLAQHRDAENQRAVTERWEWDGYSMGRTLRAAFGRLAPLHAVDAAGALPFYSELPSLDMLGLNDRHIAKTRPPEFGRGFMGHELGDGAYVLRRAPDLLSFNWPAGSWNPELRSGRELLAMSAFRTAHQWIRVSAAFGNRATGEIWIRREGGKLGVARRPDTIEIPGYFLTGQASESSAELDESNVLNARLSMARPGVLPALDVPPGRWRLDIEPASADLALDLHCDGRSMRRERASAQGAAPVFDLAAATPIGLALAPLDHDVVVGVRTLRLSRDSAPPTHSCSDPRRPLKLSHGELSPRESSFEHWTHPKYKLFDETGVVIEVELSEAVSRLELSVSGNANYEVKLVRDGESVLTTAIESRDDPALLRHSFTLATPLAPGPLRFRLKPRTVKAPKNERAGVPHAFGFLAFSG